MQKREYGALLKVGPSPNLCDQLLKIEASGLLPGTKYTIAASPIVNGEVLCYQSHAHYIADQHGVIDVSSAASCGGSYEGIEPMGLVGAMKLTIENDAAKQFNHYGKLENPRTSVFMDFKLYKNHLSADQITNALPLTQALAERQMMSPDVQRSQVHEGRLRGVLFVPKRSFPLPAIIEIGGFFPNTLLERRPSLIASHGYVTLALAYAEYDDLPTRDHLEVEYFLEAIDWLLSIPTVDKSCGVTVISSSFGSSVALHLAMYTIKVKAVITINAPSYFTNGALRYEGRYIAKGPAIKKSANNAKTVVSKPIVEIEHTIAIEKSPRTTRFLFIAGEEDVVMEPLHSQLLARRLELAGRSDQCKVSIYPGMGHLFKPPYAPVASIILIPKTVEHDTKVIIGDKDSPAALKSSTNAWQEILAFIAQVSRSSKL